MENLDLLPDFDIKIVCRICLDCPLHQVSLWEYENYDENSSKQLSEMLAECTSVNVQKNGILSEIICTDCLPLLKSLYLFRKRCIETNIYLEKLAIVEEEKFGADLNVKLEPPEDDKSNIGDFKTVSIGEDYVDEELIDTPKLENENPIKVEYQCCHCNKSFKLERSLQRHYYCCASKAFIYGDSIGSLSYPCDVCHIKFDSKPKLEAHFYNHVPVATYFDFKKDDELFFCYGCDAKELVDEVDIQSHIKGVNHSKFTCRLCSRSYNDTFPLRQHLKTHSVWPNICQICLISFLTEEEAQTHLENHCQVDSKSSYRCALCDEQFTNCSDLKEHMKIHTGTAYYCSQCGMVCRDSEAMEFHKRTHRKTCLCSLCGMTLANKIVLKRHFLRFHSSSPRVPCDLCDRTYIDKHALKKHKNNNHSNKVINNEKFSCAYDGCDYTCAWKASLAIHERVHTNDRPFKCTFPQCDAAFKMSSHLCTHMRRHTQDKRYACSVCDKKWVSGSELKKHELTHTNIRPYPCDICGKGFRKRYYVAVHKQKNHNV